MSRPDAVARSRAAGGAMGFHGGIAAERIAEDAYIHRGHAVVARRWRGAAGEIDLIVERAGVLRFVEVKKARSHDAAARRITPRQRARIAGAAEEYLAACAMGLDTDMAFDVALVDAQGRLAILEAAFD